MMGEAMEYNACDESDRKLELLPRIFIVGIRMRDRIDEDQEVAGRLISCVNCEVHCYFTRAELLSMPLGLPVFCWHCVYHSAPGPVLRLG